MLLERWCVADGEPFFPMGFYYIYNAIRGEADPPRPSPKGPNGRPPRTDTRTNASQWPTAGDFWSASLPVSARLSLCLSADLPACLCLTGKITTQRVSTPLRWAGWGRRGWRDTARCWSTCRENSARASCPS